MDNLEKHKALAECIKNSACSECPYDTDAIRCVAKWNTDDILDYCKFLKKITTKRILTSLIAEAEKAESQGGALSADWLKVMGRRLGVYDN